MALRFQQVDLRRQPLAILGAWTHQGDAPFRRLTQRIQRPEQGMTAQQQHPVLALPRHTGPEPLTELVKTVALLCQLPLNPALHRRTVGTTAQQQRLFRRQFRRGCQLSGSSFGHALPAFSFPAQLTGLPEHFPLQCGGKVLLFHPMLGIGMGVAVPDAITEGRPVAVGIPQVAGHVLAVRLTHALESIEETQHAVAFFGACQVEGGLGQRVEALRQSDPFKGRGTGLHDDDGLGIGQADVFPRRDQHAPEDEAGVLAGLHHPRQPEQGGIGIGPPQRFDEGAGGVVVGIAVLVVQHGALLDRFLGKGQVDLDHSIGLRLRALHRQFQGIEQAAGIAACHIHQMRRCIWSQHHPTCAVPPFLIVEGPLQQLVQVVRFQREQPEQA